MTNTQDAIEHSHDFEPDTLRVVYLQCDLVCQSPILTQILWATPPDRGSMSGVSEDCIAVARHVFDLHQQCTASLQSCKGDAYMVTKYVNW